ncbi:MAG: HAD family hydrolase, partial [Phycisphaerae bacterium]
MQCKAVVFDLDDTLMAESEFAISGFRAVSQAFADILQDDDAAFQFMKETYRTGNRRKIFNLLFETWLKQPADRAAVHKMIHTYRAHTPDVNLLPDAERALQRLDAHRLADRCKLALISDGPAIMQRNKVTALGLEERLDLVVLTGELDGEFGKPHPRAYEIVSNTLEIPHSQCIYI